jgi:hypothetical protein
MRLPKAFSFDDLVEYGKASGAPLVNGMPWSFSFEGHPVTHENDQCYLVGTNGERFTPDCVMVLTKAGKLVFLLN